MAEQSPSPHLSLQLLFPVLEMDLPWVWAAEKTGAAFASTKPLSRFRALLPGKFMSRGDEFHSAFLSLLSGAQRLLS